jgi:hypothetical protein
MRLATLAVFATLLPACTSIAQPAPATQQVGRFPFLEVDARAKQVRVECEALRCENPLEFFLCLTGTNEYESVLRSKVRPSHLHAALLILGLQPGEPVHFSESQGKWLPPHGPPLQLSVTFEKDGKAVTLPAWRLMRDLKNKREMPPTTWIFAGSRVLDNGIYAADQTGYLISIVNFDLTVIDTPRLASNANETLEWETNLDVMPATGTKVTLLIEPAGKIEAPPATQHAAAGAAPLDERLITVDAAGKITLDGVPVDSPAQLPGMLKRLDGQRRVRVAVANAIEENPTARKVINALSAEGIRFDTIPQAANAAPTSRPTDLTTGIQADDEAIARLRQKWEQSVAPHASAVRDAAKTHYEVISQLRREQQRLIDEADKIQRLIDQLEKRYQDMTAPGPQ